MSSPTFRLSDDAIRAALTPGPEIHAPDGLGNDIRLAIEPVAQRRPGRFAWRPSGQVRIALRVALAAALLLLLVAALWLAGTTLNPAPPAVVSTYHGGPARTGIQPGPAPEGWPQIPGGGTVSMQGPFGPWGPAVAMGLVLTGDQRGHVTANDLRSHAQIWQVSGEAAINSALTVAGDLVLVGDDSGVLRALRIADGSEEWRWTAPSGQPIHSSPAVLGDVAVVGSLGGELVALDAATGAIRWSLNPVGGQVSRGIAAADGIAYVGVGGATPTDRGTLQAWDIANGAKRWSASLQPGNTSTPAVADGRVFVTGGLDAQSDPRHALYAFDATTGQRAWPAPWSSETGQSLYIDAVADGLVLVGSSDGQLVALDAATGAIRWGPNPVGAAMSPNGGVVDGVLYATVGQQGVTAVDLATGDTIWTIKVKGEPSAPTIVDGHILVDTTLGKLVWIDGGGLARSLVPAPPNGG